MCRMMLIDFILQLHVGESISLKAEQFRCYVKDAWGWRDEFSTLNSTYETVSSKYR